MIDVVMSKHYAGKLLSDVVLFISAACGSYYSHLILIETAKLAGNQVKSFIPAHFLELTVLLDKRLSEAFWAMNDIDDTKPPLNASLPAVDFIVSGRHALNNLAVFNC